MADKVNIATAKSRAYDAGNYANAYVTQDFETAWAEDCEVHKEYELDYMRGFFSSYEIYEVNEEYQETLAYARREAGEEE